ncbi:hypothetical protein [Burkholderia gladioli]|uniref:hypothetical protein n=1 Tax=Burkholderia gladioli TaxID=28095 RepID=UPI001F1518A6|nr:hypothetical protein [Burkholderia gladioli]
MLRNLMSLPRQAAPRDTRWWVIGAMIAVSLLLAILGIRAELDGASFWQALSSPIRTTCARSWCATACCRASP